MIYISFNTLRRKIRDEYPWAMFGLSWRASRFRDPKDITIHQATYESELLNALFSH